MSDEVIDEVVQDLHHEHGKLMAAAEDRLYSDLTRAVELLPKDGFDWAIASNKPLVFARSKDTIFQIALHPDENRATIASRPLNCEQLMVALEWVELEPESLPKPESSLPNAAEREQANSMETWWETSWTFHYVDQGADDVGEWQQVRGKIRITGEGERPDRRERFARTLAALAGWERRKTSRAKRP
jgi:hypothetical protein